MKAITFDLEGVYFPDGKARFLSALQELGVLEDEARRVFLQSDEMNNRYKLGKMSDEDFWGWAVNEWSLNMSVQDLINLLIESYRVDTRVDAVVKRAKAQGYKTLVCSNNFPARVNGLNQRLGFLDNFDVSVFSYEVGAAKPSKVIFEELIKRADLPAESIVFADDNPDKLSGAKQLGIKTFVYENFEQFMSELNRMGVKL
jgi:HAD superfamily hydrolase (TIGR01509 family)